MENKLFENIFNESQDNNYGWFINSKNTADVLKVGDKFYSKLSQKNTQSLAGYMNGSKNILTF